MHTPVSRVKYLYCTILYIIQICFIYTAIYAFWVPSGFYDPSHCASGACAPVTGLNNHIYLSVMTLTTLGSGFQASSGLAQWLQISQVTLGLLLLAVGLAAFVGSLPLISLPLSGRDGRQSYGDPPVVAAEVGAAPEHDPGKVAPEGALVVRERTVKLYGAPERSGDGQDRP